ncbi:hypothetical protein AAES_89469 [Amazona aestiva]|uniref:Uncharacterized protein n=1 Tax=Amazona aestiva TaxID=12930 RepID=A0A0Q3TJP3_AMAAE|nr:hypothetical protein AAES_89469 [Amazona aestiva]
MGVTPRSRRRELLRELLQLRLQQELEELLSIVGREHPHARCGLGLGRWFPGWMVVTVTSPQSEDNVTVDVLETAGGEMMPWEDTAAAGTEHLMQERCWKEP